MTLAAFLARYPEFSEARASVELIQACLDQASRLVSGNGWGSQLGDARGEQAAHLLATSPWGQQAGMTENGARVSTYGTQLEARKKAVFPRALVSRF